jgi:hypothetical protein
VRTDRPRDTLDFDCFTQRIQKRMVSDPIKGRFRSQLNCKFSEFHGVAEHSRAAALHGAGGDFGETHTLSFFNTLTCCFQARISKYLLMSRSRCRI